MASPPPVAVLVPVKAFAEAKLRLVGSLDAGERFALARRMADRVLAAAGNLPVAVVCGDDETAAWAAAAGATVVRETGTGLNDAVVDGMRHWVDVGVERVIVAHADLPLAADLAWVADFDGVTLVPDRHDDGTNVACVPAALGFRFAYGPGSLARHVAEAERLGAPLRVVRDAALGYDVDVPADLDFAP